MRHGGYETTRTIEARSIVSARKKAREVEEEPGYGTMTLLNVEPMNVDPRKA